MVTSRSNGRPYRDTAGIRDGILRATTDVRRAVRRQDVRMPLRVVLVDDDDRYRATARRSLAADGVEVVAEVADGEGAVAAVAEWQPDVVLLDIALPGIDGLEVARRLQAGGCAATVVLVSSRDAAYGRRVASGLAAGFVPKDELSLAAISAILAVTDGRP